MVRYGYIENDLNFHGKEESLEEIPLQDLFRDILEILRGSIDAPACLNDACSKNRADAQCPLSSDFLNFKDTYDNGSYETSIDNLLTQSTLEIFADFQGKGKGKLRKFQEQEDDNAASPDCSRMAKDFIVTTTIGEYFPQAVDPEVLRPGSLLRWLLVQMNSPELERKVFDAYLKHRSRSFSSALGVSPLDSAPMSEIVETLIEDGDAEVGPVAFDESLLSVMKQSVHPPHVAEKFNGSQPEVQPVHGSAFPFCLYDKETNKDTGLKFGPYGERYCNSFQTTVNEVGLCYTINNVDLGTSGMYGPSGMGVSNPLYEVRKVQGCGKKKGFRIVVDSQRLFSAAKTVTKPGEAFKVFVTVPGVVTHKVPFAVDPTFQGEYSFYIHGIHFIDASPQFVEFNKEAKVSCYFLID